MKWKFGSRRSLAVAAWCSVAILILTALVFYQIQNQLRPVGGAIAISKAAWLALAILLWLVLPALLVADTRVSTPFRRAFSALLVLMLARGIVEGWMIYVTLNWSPWYGIAHNLACVSVLLWFAVRVTATTPFERLLHTHLLVTAAAFAPEIYFAWYMQIHFVTKGDGAVYFVPDDPTYADVLLATKAAVICFGLYAILFFLRWLHGSFERKAADVQ